MGDQKTHTGMVEQRELGYPGLKPFEQFGTALDLPMKGKVTMILTLDNGPRYGQSQTSQRLLMHGREVHYPKVRENKMSVANAVTPKG